MSERHPPPDVAPPDAQDPQEEAQIAGRVAAALTDTLYRSAFVGLWSQPMVACVVAYALSESVPRGRLFGWLAVFLGLFVLRTLLWLGYRRAKPTPEERRRWARHFLLGAWATGLIWGLSAPFFMPFLAPHEELFLDIAIVGASAGGLSTLCADKRVVWSYLIALLLPFGLSYLIQRDNIPLSILVLVYLAALLMVGRHFHALFARTFHLSFHNEILAERLAEARGVAEANSRAKSEFLAHMSHELRTPLNAVLGFSQVMQEEVYGPQSVPEYKEFTRLIHRSGRHLLDLISDILDLSKAEAGRLQLNEEKVDLLDLFGEIISIVRESVVANGVTLIESLPRGVPFVRADRRKLFQIMLNLLSNAGKFTASGGTVRLAVTRESDDGDLLIRVSDTGIGIASENIERVLTPFVQVDSSLNRRHQGTGLGLPLSKRFVELHGGTLSIVSKLGVGTVVTVRFPAARLVG